MATNAPNSTNGFLFCSRYPHSPLSPLPLPPLPLYLPLTTPLTTTEQTSPHHPFLPNSSMTPTPTLVLPPYPLPTSGPDRPLVAPPCLVCRKGTGPATTTTPPIPHPTDRNMTAPTVGRTRVGGRTDPPRGSDSIPPRGPTEKRISTKRTIGGRETIGGGSTGTNLILPLSKVLPLIVVAMIPLIMEPLVLLIMAPHMHLIEAHHIPLIEVPHIPHIKAPPIPHIEAPHIHLIVAPPIPRTMAGTPYPHTARGAGEADPPSEMEGGVEEGTCGRWWKNLFVTRDKWRHLFVTRDKWRHLFVTRDKWRHLFVTRDKWRHLFVKRDKWRPLQWRQIWHSKASEVWCDCN